MAPIFSLLLSFLSSSSPAVVGVAALLFDNDMDDILSLISDATTTLALALPRRGDLINGGGGGSCVCVCAAPLAVAVLGLLDGGGRVAVVLPLLGTGEAVVLAACRT